MALSAVAAGAVANVARGEQATARDRLCRFAHNHAVHDDEVAGIQISESELVLGRDVLGDGAGTLPDMHGRSDCEWNQGDEDVIAGIELESGVGHWAGSLMAGCGNNLL